MTEAELREHARVLAMKLAEVVEERARLRALLAQTREKIYLALASEDTDWEEWSGEVLPLIHDSLLAFGEVSSAGGSEMNRPLKPKP